MGFLMNAVMCCLGYGIGLVSSMFITQIGCCLFSGLRMTWRLRNSTDFFNAKKAFSFYIRAIAINSVILAAIVWAIVSFAPYWMQCGFFASCAFAILTGVSSWGLTETNVLDFLNTAEQFSVEGKEAKAFDGIMQAYANGIAAGEVNSSKPTFFDRIKSFAVCVLITAELWGICRVLPSFCEVIGEVSGYSYFILFLLCLPAGWYVACKTSNGKHKRCITTNLYIFTATEILGMLPVLMKLLLEVPSMAVYETDTSGIPYSEYWYVYWLPLALVALYVFLCFYLAKNTPSNVKS